MKDRRTEREEREGERSSMQLFIPQMTTTVGAGPCRSSELHPGLPHGGTGPSTWAVFYGFPTRSWVGSGAVTQRSREMPAS